MGARLSTKSSSEAHRELYVWHCIDQNSVLAQA